MASFNKVILLGNLTRDPQLKYLPSQTAVAEFGLAVNRAGPTTADLKISMSPHHMRCQGMSPSR